MPDQPSITIIHSMDYRGAPEEWSNTYHFSGTTPANLAAWKALADAIIAAEKLCYRANITFVQAYGYEAGNDISVAQIDYRVAPNVVVAGTSSLPSTNREPGDVAATVRWPTGTFTSRGKQIYLRKYFHGVLSDSTAPDNLDTTQRTLFGTFAAKLVDGTLPGTFRYCGPQGAAAVGVPFVSPYLTTRTLKRRGKRPPT